MRRLAAPATPPAGGVIASASATTGNGSATELAARVPYTSAVIGFLVERDGSEREASDR
jgi:hypothetical protein